MTYKLEVKQLNQIIDFDDNDIIDTTENYQFEVTSSVFYNVAETNVNENPQTFAVDLFEMARGYTGSTGVSAGKYTTTIGNGSNTNFIITHNLNTRDLGVFTYENSGNYPNITPDVERPTTNTVNIIFANPPTANQYKIVIIA